ncbi:MAG: hypothetical protein ACXAC5_03040 [Promethearchaeota archaeon]
MCVKCVDAVRRVFPEYATDDRFICFILWEKTAFPFANPDRICEQVVEARGIIFVDGEGI